MLKRTLKVAAACFVCSFALFGLQGCNSGEDSKKDETPEQKQQHAEKKGD